MDLLLLSHGALLGLAGLVVTSWITRLRWTSLFGLLNQTSPSKGSSFILSTLHSYVQDQVSLLSFLPLLTEYEQILFVSSGTTAIVLDVVLN